MASLTDPQILGCYKNALANLRYSGYVRFTDLADEWIRQELPNFTIREIAQLMYEYIEAGGEIDQVVETRPEWDDLPFHYDLRLRIGERLLYFETRLFYDDPHDPDDPTIYVVNIHDA